ncbi:hypothetical protein [Legionella genomosp. 1]|uniref:hypothetical protein n=1 Tax=Legionella genomosp. 1 TaxID=1093625 RepID=UPI001055785F|nr:hypothetical protein [Legionella genomosp. 1]
MLRLISPPLVFKEQELESFNKNKPNPLAFHDTQCNSPFFNIRGDNKVYFRADLLCAYIERYIPDVRDLISLDYCSALAINEVELQEEALACLNYD